MSIDNILTENFFEGIYTYSAINIFCGSYALCCIGGIISYYQFFRVYRRSKFQNFREMYKNDLKDIFEDCEPLRG